MSNEIIVVDPLERLDLLKSLASEVRVRILDLLNRKGPKNVNQVADELGLPQSTISANIQVLVDVGLIETKSQKARKGSQKVCYSTFSELVVAFKDRNTPPVPSVIEVAMPLGPLHAVRSVRSMRPMLQGWCDRASRCARYVP